MAGLNKNAVVIDVLAAAEKVSPSRPTDALDQAEKVADRLEAESVAEGVKGRNCPLGHPNDESVKFCGTCGIRVDDPQVAAARVDASAMRPAPVQTAEEKAERERQHMEALRSAQAFENQQQVWQPSEEGGILIHFVEDGLTWAGKVWYRGEELEIGPSHPRWPDAQRWITLTKWEQIERWGQQKFDQGPWPGRRSYLDGMGAYEQLASRRDSNGRLTGHFAGPTPEQLAQADAMAARRGRAAPAPSFG